MVGIWFDVLPVLNLKEKIHLHSQQDEMRDKTFTATKNAQFCECSCINIDVRVDFFLNKDVLSRRQIIRKYALVNCLSRSKAGVDKWRTIVSEMSQQSRGRKEFCGYSPYIVMTEPVFCLFQVSFMFFVLISKIKKHFYVFFFCGLCEACIQFQLKAISSVSVSGLSAHNRSSINIKFSFFNHLI